MSNKFFVKNDKTNEVRGYDTLKNAVLAVYKENFGSWYIIKMNGGDHGIVDGVLKRYISFLDENGKVIPVEDNPYLVKKPSYTKLLMGKPHKFPLGVEFTPELFEKDIVPTKKLSGPVPYTGRFSYRDRVRKSSPHRDIKYVWNAEDETYDDVAVVKPTDRYVDRNHSKSWKDNKKSRKSWGGIRKNAILKEMELDPWAFDWSANDA